MPLDKLIRLTVQLDVEPEKANLKETFEYLKGLKGAERVELVDLEVVKDPNAEIKKERSALERDFGGQSPDGPPPAPPLPETGPGLQRELARETGTKGAEPVKDPATGPRPDQDPVDSDRSCRS